MHRHIALLLVRPLEFRKVGDKAEAVILLVAQAQHIADFEAQAAQRSADGLELIGAEENEIAILGIQRGQQRLPLRLGEVLLQNGVDLAAVVNENPRHALRAVTQRVVGQRFDGCAGEFLRAALAIERAHLAALVRHAPKNGEGAFRRQVRHVADLHAEAQVRLVAAVAIHGLLPRQAREIIADFASHHVAEDALEQALQVQEDILLLHKRHLHVDLRELRLAIGAEILVAEAAGNLIILVHAANHQHLLENLRRLRQSVELAGMHAAGHEIIACAFGR